MAVGEARGARRGALRVHLAVRVDDEIEDRGASDAVALLFGVRRRCATESCELTLELGDRRDPRAPDRLVDRHHRRRHLMAAARLDRPARSASLPPAVPTIPRGTAPAPALPRAMRPGSDRRMPTAARPRHGA